MISAAEHPTVAKVLDRLGIVDTSARGRIADMDGIELVVAGLASRAKTGNNPAGLLIELVKTEAPALIESARRKASRRQSEEQASSGMPESRRLRAEQEALLGAVSSDELAELRQRVIDGFPEGRARDGANRLDVDHPTMQGMMAELLQEERELTPAGTITVNG